MRLSLSAEGKNCYRIKRQGDMRVDCRVYLRPSLQERFSEETALQQLADAACLPGVVPDVIGMPDIHAGFGLPIGGVMAVDSSKGVVSAGAVGMDINCGVRLLASSIPYESIDKRTLRSLMLAIEERVPAGIGRKSQHREIGPAEMDTILHQGVRALASWGYGDESELESIEERGSMEGADSSVLTPASRKRLNQVGTLGGGNHFIEIGVVDEIYDRDAAEQCRLYQGCLTVMIHTGSRGFGHQICTDYSQKMMQAAPRYGINLPSRGLAAVPINSPEGQDYLKAMICAVNLAFANRHLIAFDVRRAFADVLNVDAAELQLVYDVAHNIAKFEEFRGKQVLVHRKGATRALPPNHPDNPRRYKSTGHPALIPGSMGTSSYVLLGTPKAKETFFSVNHGAGRVLSRTAARKSISREEFEQAMGDILYNSRNYKTLLDESPTAYKDIDEVVETLAEIGITRRVARLKPLAVIKGEGED